MLYSQNFAQFQILLNFQICLFWVVGFYRAENQQSFCPHINVSTFFLDRSVFELVHWYSKKVQNKNRTKNAKGDRVRKYHFEHQTIDAKAVVKNFQDEVFPHCLKHGYKLIILDNDSKFHTKALVEAAEEEGLQIHPGSGKRCWVRRFSFLNFSF